MKDTAIRNLACAVMMQAVRDFCKSHENSKERTAILKDLRSNWMDLLTDGMSITVAKQLELHPDEIAERIRKNKDDEG